MVASAQRGSARNRARKACPTLPAAPVTRTRKSSSRQYEKGARPSVPQYAQRSVGRLLLDTGIRGVFGALVESGEHRIIDLLAGDEVHHHGRSLVAHLEWTLSDEGGHEAFL